MSTSPCRRVSIEHTTDDQEEVWRLKARTELASDSMWTVDISRRTPAEIVAESMGHLAYDLDRHGDKAIHGPGPATPLKRALHRQDWYLDEVYGNSTAVYGSPGEGLDTIQLYHYKVGRNESAQDPDRVAFHLLAGQQPQAFDPTYQGWFIGFHGSVPHTVVARMLETACNPAPVARSVDQIPQLHRAGVTLISRAQAAKAPTRADDGTFRSATQQAVAPAPPAPTRRTR
ncbi:DUF317 domain-containing protein [Kitasatospora sp. NPDC001095]